MSVTMTIKRMVSPKISFIKSFSDTLDVSGVLKENVSVEDPVIIIESSQDIGDYNYIEIPVFNRKYFAKIKSIGNNLWEVTGHVDVLSSFADAILANTAIINKQENLQSSNKYLNDGSFISQVNEFNTSYNFSGGFKDTGEFILICAGG